MGLYQPRQHRALHVPCVLQESRPNAHSVQERHRPQHPIILCSPVAHGWVRCLRREAGDLRSIAASRQLQIQALHPRTFLPCKMNSAL